MGKKKHLKIAVKKTTLVTTILMTMTITLKMTIITINSVYKHMLRQGIQKKSKLQMRFESIINVPYTSQTL